MNPKRIAAIIGAIFLLGWSGLLLSEAFVVGVRGADYNFGSEAMIGHGGWAYRSAGAYVASCMLEGLPLLGAALLLAWYARRSNRRALLGAALLVAATAAALAARVVGTT